MKHFNKLTPRQAEALAILAEECAEVAQAVTKMLRHGARSQHPITKKNNVVALSEELGDVLAAIKICNNVGGLIEDVTMRESVEHKLNRLRTGSYLHHVTDKDLK